MSDDLTSLRARAERELEYAEWAGTLRASDMDGLSAQELSERLLAACHREKALLDRLEAAERAIDKASQLQHRAEMGWADTQAALEAAEQEREHERNDLDEAHEALSQSWAQRDELQARLLAAQQVLREREEGAQWLLDTWTDPAFVRSPRHNVALACARGVLAALAAVGRVPQHVHHWVDKATLHEPSLKVCECGATMTESEYHDSVGRVPAQEPQ